MGKVAGPLYSSHVKGPVGLNSFDRAGPLATVKSRASKPCDFGPASEAVHMAMKGAQLEWTTLSDARREEWRRFSVRHPRADPYCGRRTLTARQTFIAYNVRLLRVGLPSALDPPSSMPTNFLRHFGWHATGNFAEILIRFYLSDPLDLAGYIEIWSTRSLPSYSTSFDKRRMYFHSLYDLTDDLITFTFPQADFKYGIFLRFTTLLLCPTLPIYDFVLAPFA